MQEEGASSARHLVEEREGEAARGQGGVRREGSGYRRRRMHLVEEREGEAVRGYSRRDRTLWKSERERQYSDPLSSLMATSTSVSLKSALTFSLGTFLARMETITCVCVWYHS